MQEGIDFLSGDNWTYNDVTPYLLDFREQYKPPRYTLSWKGVPFAPLGGIHNITGQSGNGKTMVIAQFMATMLCGKFGELKYELVEEIPHPKVLYIDTEMEKDNTIAVKNRVLSMAGRNIGEDYDDFIVVMLRDVEEFTERDKDGRKLMDKKGRPVFVSPAVVRWRMTLKAIWQFKPTAVFIDGLLDVVSDFNDNIECQELIFKCMKVASHYDASLWCILHQNPGGEKLVGHLGSFLERKVTDVIQTKKERDKTTGDITFEVKQRKARSRDFDDWKFRVLPVDSWGIPEQILDACDCQSTEDTKQTSETRDYFKTYHWTNLGATYTELEKHLRKMGVTSNRKISSMFNAAKEAGIIFRNDKNKYHYREEIPDDDIEELPFDKQNDIEENRF